MELIKYIVIINRNDYYLQVFYLFSVIFKKEKIPLDFIYTNELFKQYKYFKYTPISHSPHILDKNELRGSLWVLN